MTCQIEGCTNPIDKRGWCSKHYGRWYRTGDPLKVTRSPPAPGAICSEPDCGAAVRAQGLCGRHYQRQRNGYPKPRPRKSDRYQAMHWRLTRDQGPARDYPCADCGRKASHWSYDGMDSSETTDGYKFSTDPSRYQPRCSSCHTKLDKRRKL